MDLREYVATLRKQWLLVAVLVLVGVGVGVYRAESTPAQYRATSKVFVSLSRGSTVQELVQGSDYTQNLVQSYAALTTMPVVLDPVIDQLGLDVDASSLAHSINADTPLDTVIIQIAATRPSAGGAADVANAVADQLSRTITQISPQATDGDTVNVQVVSRADPPSAPVAPRKKLIVLTMALAGLVLGIVLALLRSLLDTRVRSEDDIRQLTDAAILGAIPRLGRRSGRAITALHPRSVPSESYRRVQTNLQFLDASAQVRSIVVTSALDGEGKSVTAINLSLAIAEKGLRVLLVDADMRRPSLADYCHVEGAAGLTTVLIGKAELDAVVQPWGQPSLDVLPLGEIPPNPSQLLDSPPMRALLERAVDEYDLVILDAPPLLPVTDAAVLARVTDGALVVAGCHKVHRHQLAEALASLEAVDARCLGVVANRVASNPRQSYYGEPRRLRHRLWARPARGTTASVPPFAPAQKQSTDLGLASTGKPRQPLAAAAGPDAPR